VYWKGKWKGKEARRIAKHPTMTLPYGSSPYGLDEHLRDEGETPTHASYLARVLDDARTDVVLAAPEAMKWLKEVARFVVKGGKPIHWATPLGFIVQQGDKDYRKTVAVKAKCTVGGRRIEMTLQEATDGIKTRKQISGISANFVHSRDAAHLMRTVSMCKAEGIDAFAMVHDSFGTHAGDAPILLGALRVALSEQYDGRNILAELRDQLLPQVPEKYQAEVPAAPEIGKLDLSLPSLMAAQYLFA
jgi:DNA-directed RNA polymerase